MADATQIDQILFNLAANARDAMKKGGKLTIETKLFNMEDSFRMLHGFGDPGRYALMSVSDTGCGMDESTREKIFDPFFTTKELGKGTGLGLSTVYGIVKQHNGYIMVSSEPDMGTTFLVYFPVVETLIKEEETFFPVIRGGNETILIAEDDTSVRLLLKETLAKYGYKIFEATDGQDAVEKFKEYSNIDLIILDSVMPRKNGREAYDEIRKIEPLIKTIFMSGYTRDIVLDKGVEEKKVDFVSKPISPDIILKKIREVLER
jgi:CheY-like chemotaxis protein